MGRRRTAKHGRSILKPRKKPKTVTCPECGYKQADLGKDMKCELCDFHPMPSRSYSINDRRNPGCIKDKETVEQKYIGKETDLKYGGSTIWNDGKQESI